MTVIEICGFGSGADSFRKEISDFIPLERLPFYDKIRVTENEKCVSLFGSLRPFLRIISESKKEIKQIVPMLEVFGYDIQIIHAAGFFPGRK